ncbi:MAG: hypothetical protein ACE5EZ_01890 [Thermodesulfobacteriota bacterium]
MGRSSRQKKKYVKQEKAEAGAEAKAKKAPERKGRTLRCYKCAKEVSEFDTGCPHCGAKPPRFNPAILARVLLGIIIAIILYIYLM